MEIIINQLGYHSKGYKQAIVIAKEEDQLKEFKLIKISSGDYIYKKACQSVGKVDNWKDWYFWQLEFTEIRQSGEYFLEVETTDGLIQSNPFNIKDNLILEQTIPLLFTYFKSQRCSGVYDKKDQELPFVGERDEKVDVHGGWYDASGDVSKYLSHLSYTNYMNPQQTPMLVWALMEAYQNLERKLPVLAKAEQSNFYQEALHGADFLMRMLDPDGYFYMTVFDRWSHDPEQREICAYETQDGFKYDNYQAGYRQGGGMAIAALARASQLNLTGDYSPMQYRESAVLAFEHLEENNLNYLDDGKENIIDDYCALMAATELYQALPEDRFIEAARKRANSLCDRVTTSGWWRADDDGARPYFHAAEAGLPVVALCRYLEVFTGIVDTKHVLQAIKRSLDYEINITKQVTNPFGYARQYVKALEGEPRTSFFFPHKNESGYWWQGENARLASLASAARIYCQYIKRNQHLTEDNTASCQTLDKYASQQLDWILGLNPFSICMLNGAGYNNIEYGDGENYPGGIINGISSGFKDESDIDFMPEEGNVGEHRWRWSEQWLPHAAWFLLAICS